MKKVLRSELRKIVMSEAKRVTEGFSTSGPGLEIFTQGRWANPYDWNMVWQSSIADVIEPMLKRGVSIDKILNGAKDFQREKIAKSAAELGFEPTPFPGETKPQPSAGTFSSTGANPAHVLTTQELFKLFSAGYKGTDLEGIDKSSLTAEMEYVLRN